MTSRIYRRLALSFSLALLGCLSLPTAVRAQDAAPASGGFLSPSAGAFGAVGQWVYSVADPGEFPPLWLDKTGGGDWRFIFQPAADTFIVRNFSVGGTLKLVKAGNYSEFGIGARAGYNIGLTSLVSLWLRGSLFYDHSSNNGMASSSATVCDIRLPFLFHVAPHFFLGIGPSVKIMVSGGDPTVGLTSVVGGYL